MEHRSHLNTRSQSPNPCQTRSTCVKPPPRAPSPERGRHLVRTDCAWPRHLRAPVRSALAPFGERTVAFHTRAPRATRSLRLARRGAWCVESAWFAMRIGGFAIVVWVIHALASFGEWPKNGGSSEKSRSGRSITRWAGAQHPRQAPHPGPRGLSAGEARAARPAGETPRSRGVRAAGFRPSGARVSLCVHSPLVRRAGDGARGPGDRGRSDMGQPAGSSRARWVRRDASGTVGRQGHYRLSLGSK